MLARCGKRGICVNTEWRDPGVGCYILLIGCLLLALVACATDLRNERETTTLNENETSEDGPTIDLTESVDTKTATFALG
jgi:hypothetical protein